MSEVYEQVVLTCTTINVVIIIGCVVSWIVMKVHDRREETCKEQEKRNNQ